MFARFGIPEKLQADNMPFNSREFLEFAREWDFECIFSSPRYPKSNGLEEKGVPICKALIKKSLSTKTDISKALMNYRNTVLKDIGLSPAQLLVNKCIKTKLPCTLPQLRPKLNSNVIQSHMNRRKIQKTYYDKQAKPLNPLSANEKMMLYDSNSKTWKPAQVEKICAQPRSYIVKTNDGQCVRRNRSFLKKIQESTVRRMTWFQGYLYPTNVVVV